MFLVLKPQVHIPRWNSGGGIDVRQSFDRPRMF